MRRRGGAACPVPPRARALLSHAVPTGGAGGSARDPREAESPPTAMPGTPGKSSSPSVSNLFASVLPIEAPCTAPRS
jgi:hypothetical protein